MKRILIFLLACIFLVQLSASASLGVSPGFIDYNQVNPGQEQEIKFYLTTSDIDEEFTVSPEYQKAVADYAMGENPEIDMANVSQQDISPWISFDREKKTIDPSTSETYTLPDGTRINAVGVVTMKVDIPANAEPGYRIGTLELNPSLGGQGSSARVIAQTEPGFAFRIPGTVERNIEHVGLEARRIGQNEVQIIHQFRNTGTVTTTLDSDTAVVYDSSGKQVGNYLTTSITLEPGEFAEMSRLWSGEKVEGGEYRVEGTAEYLPGETYISGQFAITDLIQQRRGVKEPSGGVADEAEDIPWLLILIISVLVATLLYLMEVEDIWIASFTVMTAVILYILFSSASNLLILIPLACMAVLLYV